MADRLLQTPRCVSCRYFTADHGVTKDSAVSDQVGECHRFPSGATKQWSDWCGEFAPLLPVDEPPPAQPSVYDDPIPVPPEPPEPIPAVTHG